MDAASRQKALNEISPEDLDKIKAHQASTKGAQKVDQEWLLLAEFALKFGWDAYIAAKTDKINIEEMLTLIEASRKLEAAETYNSAKANLIGSGSAQSKNPAQTFKKLTKPIINQAKVDE